MHGLRSNRKLSVLLSKYHAAGAGQDYSSLQGELSRVQVPCTAPWAHAAHSNRGQSEGVLHENWYPWPWERKKEPGGALLL